MGQPGVDYDKLLTITNQHLERAIGQGLLLPRAPGRPLVVVYGGALHNDLFPDPTLAKYTFGRAVHAATRGAYREVDLYVPEMVDTTPALKAEPWYRAWQRAGGGAQRRRHPRSPRSAIVVFRRGRAAVDCRRDALRATHDVLARLALLARWRRLRRRRSGRRTPATAAPAASGSASSGPGRACRSARRATVWSSPRRRPNSLQAVAGRARDDLADRRRPIRSCRWRRWPSRSARSTRPASAPPYPNNIYGESFHTAMGAQLGAAHQAAPARRPDQRAFGRGAGRRQHHRHPEERHRQRLRGVAVRGDGADAAGGGRGRALRSRAP